MSARGPVRAREDDTLMRLRHMLAAVPLAGAAIALGLALGDIGPVGATASPPAGPLRPLTALDRAARGAFERTAQRARLRRVAALSRTRARLTDDGGDRGASVRALARFSGSRLRAHERRLRSAVRRLRRTGGAPDVPIPAALEAIARCESGGDPRAVSADGTYRGLFQFDRGTWASVGGRGDPAAASREEQYRRAAILYQRAGTSPWPVCAR